MWVVQPDLRHTYKSWYFSRSSRIVYKQKCVHYLDQYHVSSVWFVFLPECSVTRQSHEHSTTHAKMPSPLTFDKIVWNIGLKDFYILSSRMALPCCCGTFKQSTATFFCWNVYVFLLSALTHIYCFVFYCLPIHPVAIRIDISAEVISIGVSRASLQSSGSQHSFNLLAFCGSIYYRIIPKLFF